MSGAISSELRSLVRQRANFRCEYCLLHEDHAVLAHEPDHIIAVKHRGPTTESNIAWACFQCNRSKGSDIASIDIETGKVIRLFNPRTDVWLDHFRVERGMIVPLTDIGRVTEYLLKFNLPENVELRQRLAAEGRYGVTP